MLRKRLSKGTGVPLPPVPTTTLGREEPHPGSLKAQVALWAAVKLKAVSGQAGQTEPRPELGLFWGQQVAAGWVGRGCCSPEGGPMRSRQAGSGPQPQPPPPAHDPIHRHFCSTRFFPKINCEAELGTASKKPSPVAKITSEEFPAGFPSKNTRGSNSLA